MIFTQCYSEILHCFDKLMSLELSMFAKIDNLCILLPGIFLYSSQELKYQQINLRLKYCMKVHNMLGWIYPCKIKKHQKLGILIQLWDSQWSLNLSCFRLNMDCMLSLSHFDKKKLLIMFLLFLPMMFLICSLHSPGCTLIYKMNHFHCFRFQNRLFSFPPRMYWS